MALFAKRHTVRVYQRFCYVCGCVLLGSGVLHAAIWALDGSSWDGPLAWRKPILFGFSMGVTVLSVTWIAGLLRSRWGDRMLYSGLAIALVAETALITLQTWRGVPSHFNFATPFDAAVLWGMATLITGATAALLEVTRRCLGRIDATPDTVLAVRSGMVLLIGGSLIGFAINAVGLRLQEQGLPPETYGQAGGLKFPHGVPLHAIQVLPLLAWALLRLGVPSIERTRHVACASAAFFLYTGYSLLQTFLGLARFDVTLLSGAVLAAAAVAFLWPWIATIRRRRATAR